AGAGAGAGAAANPGSNSDAYLRVKGVKGLPPRALAAFRELYRWREGVAERDDRAPFRVIGADHLLAVSRTLPTTAADLERIRGLPASLARRHGAALLSAVARAQALADSDLPRVPRAARPPRDPGLDERVDRLKAARNRVAATLGLDPGVLCGGKTLEAVARAHPKHRAGLSQVGELRRWQVDVLGDALLEALR
ncbi:MAG: HRDC domain-containing protein, partial [Gemmatimonadales bacterium]